MTIHGRTDLTFPYAPSHISYMLLELLKNSMRATVEMHGLDKMPPIRVIIADGEVRFWCPTRLFPLDVRLTHTRTLFLAPIVCPHGRTTKTW